MRLLALDQSSHISGYSIFIDGKLEKYGKFEYDDPEVGKRLLKIKRQIEKLVKEYQINHLAFEDIQLQNNFNGVVNVKTHKILAEVFGVCELTAVELGIKYDIIHSQTWKSTCNIKGRARAEQKQNAQKFVSDTYGIKATQDECDAICIGTHVVHENQNNWA